VHRLRPGLQHGQRSARQVVQWQGVTVGGGQERMGGFDRHVLCEQKPVQT
jgi:hypothetical protein